MEQEYQLYVMVHDQPSARLAQEFKPLGAIPLWLNVPFMNDKKRIAKKIARTFKGKLNGKTPLVIYGSGSNHHYTYGLCNLADERSNEYDYVHIDWHKDFGAINHFDPIDPIVSCGDFVAHILNDTYARKSIQIGQSFRLNDEKLIRNRELVLEDLMFSMRLIGNEKRYAREKSLLKNMADDVYVSIDLDVLKEEYILTDYGNGFLELKQLLGIVSKINQERRVIGLDICGSSVKYISDRDIQTHKKIVERILHGGRA